MIFVLLSLVLTLRRSVGSHAALQLEVLALRHQLQVLQRTRPRRLRLAMADRWLWVWMSRIWSGWRTALVIVQRDGDRLASPRLPLVLDLEEPSAYRSPTVARDVRTLIRTMSEANPLWAHLGSMANC